MKRESVFPLVATIVLMLILGRLGYYNEVMPVNTQMALAKTSGNNKSTNSDEHPTLSDSGAEVGRTGISLSFIAACLILAPAVFKVVGGTLYYTSDTAEGIKGLK